MTPRKKRIASVSPLCIEGELNIYRAREIKEILLKAVEDNPALDLDLSAVTEFDAAGLQLLLLTKRCAKARQGQLHIVVRSAAVEAVLGLLNLDPCLEATTANDSSKGL